ncbi:hypothetical protein BKA64DRAFT_648269 [Cadophora sp. MPI-SDFR-AT-0126]|nr:hypothetical protein BKA64DRAFT_648269 [Leotiomycetes sp. MPI-SDFR-AT-0126]
MDTIYACKPDSTIIKEEEEAKQTRRPDKQDDVSSQVSAVSILQDLLQNKKHNPRLADSPTLQPSSTRWTLRTLELVISTPYGIKYWSGQAHKYLLANEKPEKRVRETGHPKRQLRMSGSQQKARYLIQGLTRVSHLHLQGGISVWINKYWPQLVNDISSLTECEKIVKKAMTISRDDMHESGEGLMKILAGEAELVLATSHITPHKVILLLGTAYSNSTKISSSTTWASRLTMIFIEAAIKSKGEEKKARRKSIDNFLKTKVGELRYLIPDRMDVELEHHFGQKSPH